MPLTTTITFADLIAHYRDELSDYEDAYDELTAYGESEYGDQRAEWPDELTVSLHLINEGVKTTERRIHALERFANEYESQEFEIKMLSGRELADIETELRMTAQAKDTEVDQLQAEKKMAVVDAAVTDAPEEVPREDGDPVPSHEPNALATSLFEQVQLLNQSGDTDFRPEGFGEALVGALQGVSANPNGADPSSEPSPPDAESAPPPGDS
jgi:hypothetical protein